MRRAAGPLLGLIAALLVPVSAAAASLEPVGEFDDPVYVTSEPTDSDRLLVVEQGGRIALSEDGVISSYLDLGGSGLLASGGERGLLSVAFPPDFATTGHLYVFYTRAGTTENPGLAGDLQIDEFTAAGGSVSIATRRPVLRIEHSSFANHNGGQLQFGPDGYLYIGTGDGGSGDDPADNGQSLAALLGKILRIDPRQSGSAAYTVPADNPFAGATPGADEIWSYGLRNPWRFSFDRLTGDLLIGDVGQEDWEEIDYDPAPDAGRGENFGWDCREGGNGHPTAAACPGPFTEPILEYAHPSTGSGAAAVTGGYVVRDPSVGDLYGRYLYADVYVGEIRSLVPGLPGASGDRSEGLSVGVPVSFGEDACARVYVVSLLGTVQRFVGDLAPECPAPLPPPNSDPVGTCHGVVATVVASDDGSVRGTAAGDVIVGTDGTDRIRAGGGKDLVCAGKGADRLRGGGGADKLRAGPGKDRCRGGGGADRLRSC
jgi:glucose/arabinose dehydrogenase